MGIYEDCWKMIANCNNIASEYDKGIKALEVESSRYRNPRPIKYLLLPHFYSSIDWENYRLFSQTMIGIANKVIKAYLKDTHVQKFYSFDPLLHELIMAVPSNQCTLPCSRLDIIFRQSQPILCEINCDGSAGMRKDLTVNRALLSLSPYHKLAQNYNLSYKNLISAQVSSYVQIYSQYSHQNMHDISALDAPPVVAIVNFRDANDFQENMLYVHEYSKHGINAILADPRDLVYYDDNLFFNGQKIDFVQKEVAESKLLKHRSDCEDFIKSILQGTVCFIGSAYGKIIDDKAFFALLHSDILNDKLTDKEKDFIKQYIPFTQCFKDDISLFNCVKESKNHYVLKSRDTYGGIDVLAGKMICPDEWLSVIEPLWNTNYIAQEFIETGTSIYPYISADGFLQKDSFRITIGLFCYDGVLSGFYSRASKELLINDYGANDFYLGNLYYADLA